MSTVIDVHTHMLSDRWVDALQQHGTPRYAVKPVAGGQRAIHLDGAPFMTLMPGMFDYDLRVRNMNAAGVDLAIISLTCPNVFWGDAAASTTTARLMNDEFAAAQRAHPDRIRWFASLPWQHAPQALAELDRVCGAGAVGVLVTANIAGRNLTDPGFAPVWEAIDRRGLPVLVHPTAPQGLAELDMIRYNLIASTGFVMDTTVAFSRLIFDGFFDRYPNLRLIASHGGGTIPYIVGRLNQCYDNMPACREKIQRRPSEYLPRFCLDSVVYEQAALELGIRTNGDDNMLYGSDYPHNIGDMKGCLARVDALAGPLRDKVRGLNARRVFKL